MLAVRPASQKSGPAWLLENKELDVCVMEGMETCQTLVFLFVGQPSNTLAKSDKLDACEGNVPDMLFSCLQNFLVKPHVRLIAHRYLLFDQSQTDQRGGRTGVTRVSPCSTCAEEGAQKAEQKSMVAATCLRKVWL